MKLVLDFDDTLFDTVRFKKERLFISLTRWGISATKFEESYKNYSEIHPLYNLKNHLSLLKKEYLLDFDVDEVGYEAVAHLELFVFPEYLDLISIYGRENIFILSQGDIDFQSLKIKHSEIDEKVEKIIIVDSNKEQKLTDLSLLWPSETIIFIDDKFKHMIFENDNPHIVRIFVGDVNSLNREQAEYFAKESIYYSPKQELGGTISKILVIAKEKH